MSNARTIFIAGPTASGKSAAALALAEKTGGEIVNADAMQVYRDLRLLTARPTEADEARAPHHLYGVLDGAELFSAGRWARAAADVIADIHQRGRAAIVAGGTGLYFRALEEGLSPIPETPPEIRAIAAARRAALGPEAFHAEVAARDAAMAHLPAGDAQRLIRAWEVFEATGRPLSYFQSLPRQPLIEKAVEKIVIAPPRAVLYAHCDTRAAAMIGAGAIEEVRAMLARDFDASLPVMKALGVPEITAMLHGKKDRDETLAALQQNTRRFAKRQMTWFRNQACDWPCVETAPEAVSALEK